MHHRETVNVVTKGIWPVKIIKDCTAFPVMAGAQLVLSKLSHNILFQIMRFGTIQSE